MLNELYAEKQCLDTKYRELAAQKKQYKVVLFLCLIVICCVIGLFMFNQNMQSKDSQIKNLSNTVAQQHSDIEKITTEKDHLYSENERLNYTINDQNSTINYWQNEYNTLKSSAPVWYQATSDAYYYYTKNCETPSSKSIEYSNCMTRKDGTVQIYKIVNGYGLTEYGWTTMNNWEIY